MNIFDILITLLLIAAVASAVIHIVKGRAGGACSCGDRGECAGCDKSVCRKAE